MSKTEQQVSTKGWNWGYYHFQKDKMDFTHDKDGHRRCFGLNYKDIAISNDSKANEVTLEFNH